MIEPPAIEAPFQCPIARSLDVIGERWTILILRELVRSGPRKFQDFAHSLQKATVVRAILDGGLSPCDARERYILSDEELTSWHAACHHYGIAGLQAKS